jgi:hypothetical protein
MGFLPIVYLRCCQGYRPATRTLCLTVAGKIQDGRARFDIDVGDMFRVGRGVVAAACKDRGAEEGRD